MPKRVDRTERRRHIAEAVLRLTAERGLEAVSLRDVAAEAGVSMGMVQHYFTTKSHMLLFACEYMLERINQRIQAGPAPPTGRAILRHALVEPLPLDEEQRAGTRVWLAFLARAAVEPDLAAFMRTTWAASHAYIAGQISAAQQRGEIPGDLVPDREAVGALALADGLVSHVLLGHYTPDEALTAVDDHLDRLFGGRQRGSARRPTTTRRSPPQGRAPELT